MAYRIKYKEKQKFWMIFDEDNKPKFISSTDSLGKDFGINLTFYNKAKLYRICYIDSLGRVDGPVIFYKKNGKIKHIINVERNYATKIIYTCNAKKINSDTGAFLFLQRSYFQKKIRW